MPTMHNASIALGLVLSARVLAYDFPEIRYHAILEAPVERVWAVIADAKNVSNWLVRRADKWAPATGRRFRVTVHGNAHAAGKFLSVEPQRRLRLSWPDPQSVLTIAIRPLDDHLTMLTLVHEGWKDQGPGLKHQYEDTRHRWLAAMMKLHGQFPPPKQRPAPPVVDSKRSRPPVDGLFVERSLIINGDFEFTGLGRYRGVAYGWETNTARSAPEVHAIDDKVAHTGRRSQRIAHPPDWTNFAVQQFTSHIEPMIVPHKRYRLTGWVKSEGIRNPAGWYKLGLWFTDLAGKPIGDSIKNEKRTDPGDKTVLNHDWRRYTIEAVAPPGAARAVVILTGHWDAGGTVWYDKVTLWQVEKQPTTGKQESSDALGNSRQ